MGSDPTVIRKYYDLLERTLSDNHLLDKPAQIFNLDETGMPLNPSPPLLVATRGLKNPSAVGSGDKSQITVLACCSASGYVLPPFVILDRLNLKQEFTGGEVPGTVYGLSKKGWIDGELFEMWFSCHFLAHAPPIRPILLLMDGHSSHYQPSAILRRVSLCSFCHRTLHISPSHWTKGVLALLKYTGKESAGNILPLTLAKSSRGTSSQQFFGGHGQSP